MEANKARFSRMLEAGLWLQEAGFREVGVSTNKLQARWGIVLKKVEHERSHSDRKWKLRSK